MPGIEKRLARYPQFYSRIGFVHEFRPLAAKEIRQLLDQWWTPPGVHLDQGRRGGCVREPGHWAGVAEIRRDNQVSDRRFVHNAILPAQRGDFDLAAVVATRPRLLEENPLPEPQ
jgi:hypothetical protein